MAFFMVRWNNGYGNLLFREGTQFIDLTGRVGEFPQTMSKSIIDWMYVSKYPPSISVPTLDPGGDVHHDVYRDEAAGEAGLQRGLDGCAADLRRSPLFFYLTHLWLYKLKLPGIGRTPVLPMFPTLILWVAGLAVLWWLCDRYERIKRSRPKSLLQYI